MKNFFAGFLEKKSEKLGFTLVEMVVVIAIITILLATVLLNFRDFDSKSVLKNIAYEVALTIREAQSYGIGVKKYATSVSGSFPSGSFPSGGFPSGGFGGAELSFEQAFGVHFNDGASENKFIYLFVDTGIENGICDDCSAGACQGFGGECRTVLELHSDAVIEDVCLHGLDDGLVGTSGENIDIGSGQCFSQIGSISQAAVRFKRPNPDSMFTVNEGSIGSPSLTSTNFGTLLVTLKKNRIPDYVQKIEVTTLGQVRVYGESK